MRQKVGNDMHLLTCIYQYISAHGYAPTIRELGTLAGIGSTSTVFTRLNSLEESKLIKRVPDTPRTLTITAMGREAVGYAD